MRSIILVPLVLFLLVFENVQAQENVISELPRYLIEGSISGLHAKGPAAEFLPDFSVGIEATFLYRIKYNKPFLIGVVAHTNSFERSSIEEPQEYDDGTLFTKREITASHMYSGRFAFRFQPEINWMFQPYLQGSIGFNHFFTNTKYRDLTADEFYERFNEEKSTVVVYGLRAGLHFVPNDWYWRIHASIGYLRNASTDFTSLDENGTGFYPIENFEVIQSPVEFLTFHAGALYLF